MTAPGDDDRFARIWEAIRKLQDDRVTHRSGTVTAIDLESSTFTADVEGAGITAGIYAEPQFMPQVDDIVRLRLAGATPIYDPAGINQNDTVAIQDLSVTSDPLIMGQSFSGHLAPKASFQAGASRGALVDPALTTSGETGFYEATFEFEAGHQYELRSSNFWVRPNTGCTRIDVNLRYTVSDDPDVAPPAVSIASNYFARWPQAVVTGGIGHGVVLQRLITFPKYLHFRFLLSLVSFGGTAYIEMSSENHANATTTTTIEPEVVQLWVMDTGAAPWTNRAATNTGAGTPAAIKRYTRTYYPTWVRRFSGTGATLASSGTMAQGLDPDLTSAGDQATQFGGFLRDGTGNLIATDLSGATIEKLELWMWAREWGYPNGGTAVIRYHNNASAGTLSTAAGLIQQSGWKPYQGRWVDITAWAPQFLANTAKGIQIGPAGNNAPSFFGKFRSHSQSNPPRIRATFTR